jgi:hypothetical protein
VPTMTASAPARSAPATTSGSRDPAGRDEGELAHPGDGAQEFGDRDVRGRPPRRERARVPAGRRCLHDDEVGVRGPAPRRGTDLRGAGRGCPVRGEPVRAGPDRPHHLRRVRPHAAAGGRSLRPRLAGIPRTEDDDGWRDKIDLLLDVPVPVVTFTFGIPDPAVLRAARGAGRGRRSCLPPRVGLGLSLPERDAYAHVNIPKSAAPSSAGRPIPGDRERGSRAELRAERGGPPPHHVASRAPFVIDFLFGRKVASRRRAYETFQYGDRDEATEAGPRAPSGPAGRSEALLPGSLSPRARLGPGRTV